MTKPTVPVHAFDLTSCRRQRLLLVRFARWPAGEEGFDAAAVLSVKGPKMDQAAVAALSDDELRALIKACEGSDLRDKRDKAWCCCSPRPA